MIHAKSGALTHFGGVRMGGLPLRPALINPKNVFIEFAHQAKVHRLALNGTDQGTSRVDKTPHWSWPPIYKHLRDSFIK